MRFPTILLLAAALPAVAVADEIPLYTNADLEKYGPPTSESGQRVADSSEIQDWQFVTDFIRRQHEQIAAERAHDMERARVNNEAREIERRYAPSYSPWFPYYLYPGLGHHKHQPWHGDRPGHGVRRPQVQPRPVSRAAAFTQSLWRPITPLHARP